VNPYAVIAILGGLLIVGAVFGSCLVLLAGTRERK
jgi:hypothetical protein